MSNYTTGRDGFSRDLPARPAAHRARSRSPPQGRIRRDELPIPRTRVDRDAPPQILARKKPIDSSTPAYAHASTSALASSSTYDRNAASDRPDVTASRRSSTAAEHLRDDMLLRLSASHAERSLFEQMEDKRFAISEDRKELAEQLKKIKTLQDYRSKAGANDSKVVAKLTEHQQAHSRLDQKIRSDTDELYRMQLWWQLDLFPILLEEHLKAYREDERKRYDKLKDDIADMHAHNRGEAKHLLEVEKQMRSASGMIHKCQSDSDRVKNELATLNKDVTHLRTELLDARNRLSDSRSLTKGLRDDLNKDVVQITEHSSRIRRIEDKVDGIQAKLGKVAGVARTTTGSPALTNAPAPPSPGAQVSRPLPISPVQGSRPCPRPAEATATPEPASTTTAASASAATDESSAKTAEAPPNSEAGSEAVTRSQFRKWDRDFKKDLELRLDEIKDLAIAEATAENQACMEDRLRKLARRWREKAARGETGPTDQAEGSSASAPAGLGVDSSGDAAARSATGPMPMDVDSTESQPRPSDDTAAKDITLTALATGTLTRDARPSSSIRSLADANGVEAAPSLNAEAQSASSQTSAAEASTVLNVVSAANGDLTPAAASTASPQLATVSAEEGDRRTVAVPAEVLKSVRILLKEHEAQIAAIKQEVDDFRSSEAKRLDSLLTSPVVVKRLLASLKQNGLDMPAEVVSAIKPLLQSTLSALRDELAPALEPQRSLADKVQTLEDARSELKTLVDNKADWLQKQIEALDDQCSLQGALLVKLAEHANPRKPPPPSTTPTPTTGGTQEAEHARSSMPRSALPQQPAPHAQQSVLQPTSQPRAQLQHHEAQYQGGQHQPQQPANLRSHAVRSPSALNVSATALSPHVQYPVPGIADQLRQAQAQPQQLLHHQHLQQARPQEPYAASAPSYPYHDPNLR